MLIFYTCKEASPEKNKEITSNQVDSISNGSLMYKNYCLTCHGYNKNGGYYEPALDSMFSLFKVHKLNFAFSNSHHILFQKKDSINFRSIILYMEDKYDHTLQKK